MDMTTIKISKSVKNQLDNIKFEKEPYNVVLQRLMKENLELKKQNEKLYNVLMNVSN